jgi:hypothetical protein
MAGLLRDLPLRFANTQLLTARHTSFRQFSNSQHVPRSNRGRSNVSYPGFKTSASPAVRNFPVFQGMYSPSGLHLAASRAGKQAMRQYHRDFRTVAGSAVHIVGCWEYQEWAFSSCPGNRARKNATVPASRIWRDAARRGQNPTLQPFPKMRIWRLSLIHGESKCPILKFQTTAQSLFSRR